MEHCQSNVSKHQLYSNAQSFPSECLRIQSISRFDDEFTLEEPDDIEHVLPRFPLPVTNAQLVALNNSFNVLGDSDNEGFDIYYNILRHIQSLQAS